MLDDETVLGYLVDEVWLRELAIDANLIVEPNPARLALYPESIIANSFSIKNLQPHA